MIAKKYDKFCSILLNAARIKCANVKEITYSTCSSVKNEIKAEVVHPIDHDKSFSRKITKLPFNAPSLSNAMLNVKSKKMRSRSNLIYFEGRRLLIDALNAGVVPMYVYFSRMDEIKDIDFPEETQLFKTPYNDLKIWSDLTTCPGLLAICRKPDPVKNYEHSIPVIVICDNLREPGNLGACIRNCAGAGVKTILLSEGCVDVWDSKVLRGSMGSHFRLPIHSDVKWTSLPQTVNENALFVIALNENKKNASSSEENITPYYNVKYSSFEEIVLVVGGETVGVSANALKLANSFNCQSITIPLSNGVESLNSVSALSIILYEIKRQFCAKDVETI